ncbi:IS3 family transposase [Anaerosalibacter massiliensis]|uniref:IS3 family transposase n=1 Tax=Anaerosalibacter massiliensis TaxID=1347392 RepID=UPI0009DF8028
MIYRSSKGRYGAPKIYEKLKSKNIFISLKKTQRIMNKLGIKSVLSFSALIFKLL